MSFEVAHVSALSAEQRRVEAASWIPLADLFTRGPLAYLLRNRFYIGKVVFKGETLAGEQPAIVDLDLQGLFRHFVATRYA